MKSIFKESPIRLKSGILQFNGQNLKFPELDTLGEKTLSEHFWLKILFKYIVICVDS